MSPQNLGPLKAKPKLLFVCAGNSCRSQMAEGFARALGGEAFEVFSAGSHPAGIVHFSAVQVMREAGIDISKQFSKRLSQIPLERYDVIVTMGCGDACPQFPAKRRIDWQIPDPVGGEIETFRKVRDQIEKQIRSLFAELRPAS